MCIRMCMLYVLVAVLWLLPSLAGAAAATAQTGQAAAVQTSAVTANAQAEEAGGQQPLRVARVPLVVSPGCWMVPEERVQADLETQIDHAMHVPLNGVLHYVDNLPEEQCEQALADAYAALGRRAHLKQVVRHMGEQLPADLVVVPMLTGYEQYVTYGGWNWDRGPILHSYAAVVIGIYDHRTDEAFVKTASRMFHDEYSSTGDVATLAHESMQQVIQETNLYQRVHRNDRSQAQAD
ncbi:MAG: hypothetical protein II145_08840 [Selenomonas sp.]|nr:hypothetical protein [Selenomonas sp.]